MAAGQAKLPVGAVLSAAFGFVFGNLPAMTLVALVPLLLTFVAQGAAVYGLIDAEAAFVVVGAVLLLAAIVPFMTAWHRATLFGLEHEPARIGLAFGARELRYILATFLLGLMGIATVAPGFALLAMGGATPAVALALVALGFVMLYLFARFALVLPALAAGLPTGAGAAWRQSEGNGVRLAVVLFLAELPFRLLDALLTRFAAERLGLEAQLGFDIVSVVLAFLSIGVLVSALSTAYRILAGPDQRSA